MVYDAMEVAKYVISICYRRGIPISNLKLQKILYFIQGESFAKLDKPMFSDDICAWQFGPVVPEVYYAFCIYAATQIMKDFGETSINKEDLYLIDSVIEAKKDTQTWQLVGETHEKGTPWDTVYNAIGNRSVIPTDIIKKYFLSKR